MPESYQYRQGYRGLRKVDPNVAYHELRRLADEGDLRPSRIVEEATPETAPLHGEFTWDDAEAAHEYRLGQARHLARAVVVVPIVEEQTESEVHEVPASAFVHVPAENGKGEGIYIPLDQITDNTTDFERAFAEALRKSEAAERAVRELRQQAGEEGNKAQAVALALEGFSTVRAALAILKN